MRPSLIEDMQLIQEIDRIFDVSYDSKKTTETEKSSSDYSSMDPRTAEKNYANLDSFKLQRIKIKSAVANLVARN